MEIWWEKDIGVDMSTRALLNRTEPDKVFPGFDTPRCTSMFGVLEKKGACRRYCGKIIALLFITGI